MMNTPGTRTRRRLGRSSIATLALGVTALLAAACSSSTTSTTAPGGSGSSATPGTSAPAYPMDNTIKLNQIQVLGSHNSYHQRTPQAFRDFVDTKTGTHVTTAWDYEHSPLDVQFSEQGVRQIELDIHLDPDGRYAVRHAMPAAGLAADAPAEMKQPGLKVFHIQELDFQSSCLTFIGCLKIVKQWSDANAGHVPIFILVEAKNDHIPDPFAMGFTTGIDFDKTNIGQIDDEIHTVFTDDQLVTPDQVRGTHKTLEEAVLAGAWPTLGQSRGKVMFGLDNSSLRQAYADGHPSLQGRVLFTNSEPGEPEAAFVERNDSVANKDEITDLVKKGYVVRTWPDGDDAQIAADDQSTVVTGLTGGGQWISTDYPIPEPKKSATYVVKIPGGTPGRCNPINAPAGCTSTDIENPAALKTP